LLAGWSAAAGQSLVARLQLERGSVFVGEPFNVWVRAVGGFRPDKPDVSQVRDFEVQYLGRRVRPSVGETVFAFRFVPTRIGSLVIPPLAVEGRGFRTKTTKTTVQVASPPPDNSPLTVAVEESRCFVGQQVVVTVDFEPPESSGEMPEFYLPFLGDERLQSVLLTAGAPPRLPDGSWRIRINGELALASIRKSTSGWSLRFQLVVIPEKTGTVGLGTATVKVEPRPGHGSRTFATASAGAIEVSALPPPPNSFSGLVGQYEFSAEAEPRSLKVGEPTKLSVSASGQPYMAEAALPALEQAPALVRDFQVERIAAEPSLEGASKVFSYRLRPKRDDIRLIPPLEVTLFDPREGKFVSRSTRAIPLTVLPNKVVTSADAEGPAPGNKAPQLGRPATQRGTPDAGRTLHELLSSGKQTAFDKLGSPLWQTVLLAIVALSLAPPVYRVARWVLAVRAARTVKELSPIEEFRGAMEQITRSAGSAEQGSWPEISAVRRYLKRKLGLKTSTPTFMDARTALEKAGASAGSIESLRKLFDAEDALRYGLEGGSSRVNRKTMEKLVAQLEAEMGPHHS
jgi:hypothetical protein